VVLTDDHREQLERRLEDTIDLHAARQQGLYRLLDAERTLALFVEDGIPRAERFERELGRMIEIAGQEGRPVRVFGEMVAVLWAKGNIAGALRLEDLWNGLAEKQDFRLFCAYPTTAFGDQNPAPLRAVCQRHSHVIAAQAKN
jgi:hypothetical protein